MLFSICLMFIQIAPSILTSPWYDYRTYRLPKREGVAVGYERKINLVPGKDHVLKTLSVKPALFEVKDFLTPEECEYLIYMAKETGLDNSETHPQMLHYQTTQKVFSQWDKDNSSFVEPIEFSHIVPILYLTDIEIKKMIVSLNIDKNGDNRMDFQEFTDTTAERIQVYLLELYNKNTDLRNRISKQAWLWHYGIYDDLIENFHDRLSLLTLLPREIIEMSEPMQVVQYEKKGHFHCHLDSDEIDDSTPCCTYYEQIESCRLCRYVTIMFFLNNVTEGGETAFQLANNRTFSYDEWAKESHSKCNLIRNCNKSNLVKRPLQGTALFWYNHDVDDETGWLGELDLMMYHGGCHVINATKWIANSWINIIGEKGSPASHKGWFGVRLYGSSNEL